MTVDAVPLAQRHLPSPTGEPAFELDRFREALQPRIMGPRLAAALAATPATCRVLDAKYQPGIGATVLYEVDGRLVRADLLDRHPTRGPAPVPAGAPVVAPGLALFPFPADPDLRGLPEVMDPARFGLELTDALGRGGGTAARCSVRLLRYRPGKRATVEAELRFPSTRFARTRFVAKVYHDATKASAVVEESEVLQHVARTTSDLRFAPTVAWLSRLTTVVQGHVTGAPLGAVLGAGRGPLPAAAAGVRRAARAVAELHEARPATIRQRPVQRELSRFSERSQRIGSVDPETGSALQALSERLLASHRELPPPELGTVHGDCKPSQFILDDLHVYLLDVDHLGVSDLATDVGTFMASLRQGTVERGWGPDPEARNRLAEAFLESYLDARAGGGDPLRCRWQEAVALQRKALRAYARAPRSPVALALTAAAHRCLDAVGERP